MSEASIKQDDLPTTWALTNLGSVVNYGSTSKAEPIEIADGDWVLELEDIEKDSSRLLQKTTFLQRQSKSTKNRFQAGDVLYGKLRPYLNKVLIADEPGYCTTEILPLKAGTHIDNRYLFYWLKHPISLKYVEAESHGMNTPRLGTETGKAAPFVLAPRNEQTRIANQLDTLLTRVQDCNDRFDAIPALLKRFRQTVLDAALNGAFLDGVAVTKPELPKVSISTIASVGTGSTPLRSNSQFFAGSGTPWITSSATSAAVVTSANEFVTPAAISAHRLKLFPKGTLLVAMYGKGKTRGQVAELGIDATINQACAAVVVNESKAIRAYVKLALQANYLNMRELAEGGNQPNLNLSKVKEFEIPLPSLADQTEIVRCVEALFALADRIEARCTAARAQAQRLTPLVLAKAFRGELVPQDPNDEPARELMARIASSNTAMAGKSKQKVPLARNKLAQEAINL
jgi:type I restriction enzyme S subunit